MTEVMPNFELGGDGGSSCRAFAMWAFILQTPVTVFAFNSAICCLCGVGRMGGEGNDVTCRRIAVNYKLTVS